MTELERMLIDRLDRIEIAHQQQTAALEQQLQQQARSLNNLQDACINALATCGTLCGELQSSLETLRSEVERTNTATSIAFGKLSSSVSDLNEALDDLQRAQS